ADIGDRKAVEPVIRLLHEARALSDADREEACIYVLAYLGEPNVFQEIEISLHSRSADVRMRAADVLGKLGIQDAIKPLVDVMGDEEISVRRDALKALAKYYSRDESVSQAIISALNDEHPAI